MLGPMVALAAATVVGGVLVLQPAFLGVDAEDWHPVVMVVSLAVVAGGVLLTLGEWARVQKTDPAVSLGRLRPVLAREMEYDGLVDKGVTRPTWWLARMTRLNEDEVVEAYVGGTDSGSQWAARLIRWSHNGNAQVYATSIVIGAVAVAIVIGVVGAS
jgi:NADH:ubiquinone oxidoreductase subunit 5 (subunit L)/multisubunit Na+/H+ antiporter MnhA subunit